MKALDFLNKAGVYYLATTDESNQAHVRPLGFVMEYDGKLTFCTSNQKNMFKQLIFNPKVEICCIDQKFNTLRILGEAVFVTSKETQAKALEIMPSLSKMYSVGDGKFEIFSIDNAKISCCSMSGKKVDIEL
ncbi:MULTISPECIES: pyridoxamine 5'-phosphate oxidase family protein [unclassified Clostridioides]|uniref:pyridoxamine 5'-phosphate oxidase family protein n=1 Tax=unclassified Clostridioides TaxID=2635829 RepID=UPI001D11ABA5|nr:pyridoxamine 5'-phosphate oxidase family protein [Clostridioides sp. ZZV14-6150]MCC0660996.1 pyridoxamine 5'-phosphate oxidase family protein [Clostridioides sp. ZZV14-6154]MCC0718167.1 pyridoxamine 5'-phosphate oxidase family protein [Clostridioides sp. ZZV14-6105]MCC0722583.1 pyridoxamine 5'-phosphate oxidase family protein [Clostridioides sp. ZZV14-6104]MCC0727093.1 pyridoxamine 5'-phosphate oxidase family protein [Clostridioides sp. ZZV14-6045]MCC0738270.1 pyridoxamine 5'-phosphate oxid